MVATELSAQGDVMWEVAVALPLARTLTYRAPPHLEGPRPGWAAWSGCRWAGARWRDISWAPTGETPPGTLRNIREVLDPIPRFGPEMVPLFRWVADYYQYPLGEALSFLIPGGAPAANPRRELWAYPVEPPEPSAAPRRLGPKSQAILTYLKEAGPTPVKDLSAPFPACHDSLRRLAARGLIGLEDRTRLRTHEG